jgi:hypothetical protein
VACEAATLPNVPVCPGSLITDTTPIIQATPQLGGPMLANLKDQLRQALDVAEKQEAAVAEGLRPQSAEEIELLEKKMTEALEELRAQKSKLKGK